MIRRFRKRPVEVEAIQFTGDPELTDTILEWIAAGGGRARLWPQKDERHAGNGELSQSHDPEHLSIATLEGRMRADIGDWIIRGIQNEFYPCKPDIFEATYETVLLR